MTQVNNPLYDKAAEHEPDKSIPKADSKFDPFQYPVSAEEAPSHARYPYVLGSYRSGGNYRENLWSLFQLHTETVNCWTMILACLSSMLGTIFFSLKWLDASAIPIFVIFTSTTVIHLPFSVGYHLFTSMRRPVFNNWRKLDVTAIFCVLVLLTFSLAFIILPWWGCLLNTLVAAAVSAAAVLSFWKTPDEVDLDPAKQSIFVGSIVICYWFPMVFATVRDAINRSFTLSSGTTIGVFAGLASSGWAYASAWPQRHLPGCFDVWGHSHQMMHIGVLVCHALEFVFLLDNWRRRRTCGNAV